MKIGPREIEDFFDQVCVEADESFFMSGLRRDGSEHDSCSEREGGGGGWLAKAVNAKREGDVNPHKDLQIHPSIIR